MCAFFPKNSVKLSKPEKTQEKIPYARLTLKLLFEKRK